MNEIYLAIQAQLAAQVSGLRFIDVDWGQLEPSEEAYPDIFPCALIEIVDVNWEDTGMKVQPGIATVRIKIAVQLVADTHTTSGTATSALSSLSITKDVNDALSMFKGSTFSKLSRSQTRRYSQPGGLKVTEIDYRTRIFD